MAAKVDLGDLGPRIKSVQFDRNQYPQGARMRRLIVFFGYAPGIPPARDYGRKGSAVKIAGPFFYSGITQL